MFPIKHYVNEYIATMSTEAHPSKQHQHVARTTPGVLDRLYKTVAGMLKKGAAGVNLPTTPKPAS